MPSGYQDTSSDVIIISDDDDAIAQSDGDPGPPPANQAAVNGVAHRAWRDELTEVCQANILLGFEFMILVGPAWSRTKA